MSAPEQDRGVGDCPERPEGFGHLWAGPQASGDSRNPCRFCGMSGREFFAAATAERSDGVGVLNARRELTVEQLARAAAIVEDKKRRDALGGRP